MLLIQIPYIERPIDILPTKTKMLVELEKLRVIQRGQLLFVHHPVFNTNKPISLLAQAEEAFLMRRNIH